MSFESITSRIGRKRQMGKRLPTKPSSPLMFDDDHDNTISADVFSQLNRSSAFNQVLAYNQVMPSQQTPSEWTNKSKNSSNEESSTSTVYLSMSQIERVSTCRLCDNGSLLNESTDYHNRSITDVARFALASEDNIYDSMIRSLPKRARLNDPSENAPNISLYCNSNVKETSDIFKKISDQTKAINDQFVTLHEDW